MKTTLAGIPIPDCHNPALSITKRGLTEVVATPGTTAYDAIFQMRQPCFVQSPTAPERKLRELSTD